MRSVAISAVLVSASILGGCDGGGGGAGAAGGGGSGGSASTSQGGSAQAGGSGAGGSTTTGTLTSCEDGVHDGKITYYNEADGSGACSFDPTPDDLMVGAMNAPDYLASAACGACAEIDGGGGKTITVRIVDLCPGCDSGHIDLSPAAFAELADLSVGVMPVTWRYVSCDVKGPIRYKFKEGSNQWWTAVQVRNHANRILTFEYEKDGVWKSLIRTDYNYFLEDQGMGEGPYHFRVTDVFGQTLEDEGIPFVEGGVEDGKGQFAACPE